MRLPSLLFIFFFSFSPFIGVGQVLGPAVTQEAVFDTVRPLVRSALDGRDICLLAYGQTGSGKTHTLVGEIPSKNLPVPDAAGVLPRTMLELFANLTGQAVFLSVLEVYNETVRKAILAALMRVDVIFFILFFWLLGGPRLSDESPSCADYFSLSYRYSTSPSFS
jgi:hypothetical protein